jgi:hypothetical protein
MAVKVETRYTHLLKGVPGEWRVFVATCAAPE